MKKVATPLSLLLSLAMILSLLGSLAFITGCSSKEDPSTPNDSSSFPPDSDGKTQSPHPVNTETPNTDTGDIKEESSTNSAHTHSYAEWITTQNATCVNAGVMTRYCSCGDMQTQPIAATGHSYGEWVVTEAATCIQSGTQTRYCSCGDTQTQSVSAKGHNYVSNVCTQCGEKLNDEPAHTHSYSEWVTTQNATCTVPGTQTRTCSCGDTQTQTISAQGHKYGNWTTTKNATCTSSGVQSRSCACGDIQTQTIAAKGHNYVSQVCTACGAKLSDDPGHSHSYGAWIVSKAATCTESGLESRSCSCGDTQTKTIAAKGHTYGAWTVTKNATCTESGIQTRTCSCGESQKQTISAKGHSFGNWVTTKAASCTETGIRTRTCSCGEKETQSIAMTSHTFGAWTVSKKATCTTDGTQIRTCACGMSESKTITAAGHNYVNKTCTVCGAIDYDVPESNIIRTPEDFNKLIDSTDTFMLGNDINLAGINWTPIKGFSGTLIGNGYTIKNLTINASEHWVGLFADLCGTVQDLSIENANITVTGDYKSIGILCGTLSGNGKISNIIVSGNVTASDSISVGGIVGYVAKQGNYSFSNLENKANVTGKENVGGVAGYFGDYYETASNDLTSTLYSLKNSGTVVGEKFVGGIIGVINCINNSFSQTIKISDTQNTGNVRGDSNVGGIVGYAACNAPEKSIIENSVCKADIEAECYVGCIAGWLENITVNNCSNEGSTLTATKYYSDDGIKYALVGGFVGYGYLINNCTNKVNINYTSTGRGVGGIMGYSYSYSYGSAKMTNLHNDADITGYDYVGGIIGIIDSESSYSSDKLELSSFTNSGKVTASDNYAGGILGYLYTYSNDSSSYKTAISISYFQNTGDVKGKLYVGGIVGYGESNSTKSFIENSSNNSNITAEAYVGCIAGELYYIAIDNCKNQGSTLNATKYATIEGVKYAYVGGFVGRGYIINNCTNTVKIDYTSSGFYVGGIAGYILGYDSAEMSNLHNTADISGYEYVGGIIGAWKSKESYSDDTLNLSAFTNSGRITSSKNYAGGIIGYLYCCNTSYHLYKVSISDFINTGDVIGQQYVGGIIGYGESDDHTSNILGCSNKSSIQAEAYAGCIAGKLVYISIDDCANEGSELTVTKYAISNSNKYAYAGGFVGYGYGASNCTNKVSINYTAGGKYVGGIMGYTGGVNCFKEQKLTFDNLINDANITGADHVGGIFGAVSFVEDGWYYTNTYNFIDMKNTGNITGTSKYAGGIFGYVYINTDGGNSWVYITDPINSGNISGNDYVGGILGYVEKNTNSSVFGTGNQSAIIDPISTGVVIGNTNSGELCGKIVNMTIK